MRRSALIGAVFDDWRRLGATIARCDALFLRGCGFREKSTIHLV